MSRPASVLDGFFTDDVEAIAAANAALADAVAPEADRSWGRVEQPTAFNKNGRWAERKGIFSEVIFGPRQVLACACGAVVGEAARGATCERCGVLCADPSLRSWRFGHIDVPIAIHPLLVPLIAKHLGVTREQIDAVLRDEAKLDGTQVVPLDDTTSDALTGGRAIEAALAGVEPLTSAAVLRRIPVPPPADRPLFDPLTPTQVTPWMGPLNEAWLLLVTRANRFARLEELAAPNIILVNEAQMAQEALTRVVRFTLSPPSVHDRIPWSGTRSDASPWGAVEVGGVPPGIDEMPETRVLALFVDARTLLVQLRVEVLVVDIEDGVVRDRFPSPGRALRSVHGRRVVFDGWLEDPFFTLWGATVDVGASGKRPDLAVYDLDERAFLTSWPADLECIAVAGHAEDLAFVDRKTGAVLRSPWSNDDGAALLAWTRDARFAWVGTDDDGGVLDLASGIPQIETAVEGDRDDLSEESELDGYAVGLTDDDAWRFVHNDGALTDGRKVLALLGAAQATAFAPGCHKIALVRRSQLEIVDGGGQRIRQFALYR